MKTTLKQLAFPVLILISVCSHSAFAGDKKMQCPDFLNQEFKKLHSSENVNLCKLYQGKPILFVNTASHCGFTKQFKPLEALHQKYKDKGFQVVGFASDDFNQEAKSEEEAAGICYKNYGVTFTMLSPTKVKGKDANPVFSHLAKATGEEPAWNFNKYLVSADGKTVKHYGSRENPLDSQLEKDISAAL